ncbi:hypothetical protein CHELA1G11_12984 [Hyphomicrobiales bacterium]|nr:hypothetical protein CHELA1G2_11326 [Hyphomicrobiales bacterium]CAH1668495.1 hypothetical protein CHELA1G11_12984 [Hyphomicrobiales bacterium]
MSTFTPNLNLEKPVPGDVSTANTWGGVLNGNADIIDTAVAGKQALDATLTAFAALTNGANTLPYFTGTDLMSTTALTSQARTFLAASSTADQRTAVGLGNVDNTSDATKWTATATLTGKTISGASNTITNLSMGMFASGVVDADGALTANSDNRLATQKAVKTYVDALLAANDAMVFKGAIDCSTNPNYPAASAGHVYRVSVAGKIGGASGPNVEVGDTLYCVTDGTSSGNQAAVGANWVIVQSNLDGAVIGPSSAVDGRAAAFDGTTGKLLKDSGKAFPSGVIVGTTDTQTLTNKTLTAPAISSPTGLVKGDVGLGNVDNTSDASKNSATATLTNKTLSASNNTISGLTTTNFAANVIDTDSSMTADSDMRVPTQKAVKAAIAASGTAGISTINTQSGTTYTLSLGDAGGIVETTHATNCTVTVPTNAAVAFPLKTEIVVKPTVMKSTIVFASGVTLWGQSTSGVSIVIDLGDLQSLGAAGTLYKRGTNDWGYIGAGKPA